MTVLNDLTGFVSIKEGFCGQSTFSLYLPYILFIIFLLSDMKISSVILTFLSAIIFQSLVGQSKSILYLNAVEISWQFKVLTLTQSFWEARRVYIVSLVHVETGKFHSLSGLADSFSRL